MTDSYKLFPSKDRQTVVIQTSKGFHGEIFVSDLKAGGQMYKVAELNLAAGQRASLVFSPYEMSEMLLRDQSDAFTPYLFIESSPDSDHSMSFSRVPLVIS